MLLTLFQPEEDEFRIGHDDLALQPRIEQIFISADIETKLFFQLHVDAEYRGGEVVKAVETVVGAVVRHDIRLIFRQPMLEEIAVNHSVAAGESTPIKSP